MELRELLNEEQVQAVMHKEGPLLILAGAGSGKTRVITYRLAWLLSEHNVSPENILCVTFTNKAAQEMKSRARKVAGKKVDKVWMSTFHSFGVRVLRLHAELLGYDKNFTIYDQEDRERLLKECMHDAKVSDKEMKVYDCMRYIQDAKNSLITPAEYMNDYGTEYEKGMVARIYEIYEKRLKRNNSMDFDDLIWKPLDLFNNNPAVLEKYREQFQYIMIDEYQDINHAQYMLISMMASKYKNICVVGDDDQSIYRFRGADITNILNFEEDYPDAKVIRLERNYRSTQTILKAAHKVIQNNSDRKEKEMWTDNDKGEKIIFYYVDDEVMEGEAILNEIDKLMRLHGADLKDIAIFYRTNAQSRSIEDRLRRAGLPYKLVGGFSFYGRMEIKDMLSYMRIIANPRDVISFKRIVNVPPRGISDTTVEKVEQFAFQNDITLLEALGRTQETENIKPMVKQSCSQLHALLTGLAINRNNMKLRDLMAEILTGTGYISFWENDQNPKAKERIENVKELVSAVAEFEEEKKDATLEDFLSQVALISEVDKLDENADAVTLMTIHSAKGLEFDNVFIAGMDEKIFPHKNCIEEEGGIEEERRLAYVGITRARKRLYLLSAISRRQFGARTLGAISRFINEIPEEYLHHKGRPPAKQLDEKLSGAVHDMGIDAQPNYEATDAEPAVMQLEPGDKVSHIKMGEGIITKIEPYGDDYRITVMFKKNGRKELSAKYAGLAKI
ncbi:MAG: ATP-dependent DNA helicase PcrA [Candidatus Goldiibacteriota bacterium HGW-Goldbacteria-1]|nr:MAG: ATP-dependent DNA helicase PcrA [Candidatus Goldiibacteriota bacterium HGW-Goldbacteria-1]